MVIFSKDFKNPKEVLSKRELEILALVVKGLRNPEIAKQINLAPKTIENHIRSMLQKTNTKNRTQLGVIGAISGTDLSYYVNESEVRIIK